MRVRPQRNPGPILALAALLATACVILPDLVIEILTAPPSLMPGESFSLSHRVCNEGGSTSAPTQVLLHLREAGQPSTATLVGLRPLGALPPGACDTAEIAFDAPVDLAEGPYEIVAVADPNTAIRDRRPADNTAVTPAFGIGYGPDLWVEDVAPLQPNVDSFAPFALEATVCNRGTDWAWAGSLMLLLSEDESISIEPPLPDWVLGDLPIPDLAPDACAVVQGVMSADVPPGVYTLGGFADPAQVVPELVESNNAAAGGVLGVGYGPDLVVASVTGPPSVMNGSSVEVETVVCNQGTGPSDPTSASIHWSDDPVIEPIGPIPTEGDPAVGWISVPGLAAGECHTEPGSYPAYAPSEGAWYLGAFVDDGFNVAELQEGNNAHSGSLVGVGTGPDLVVSALDGPPSAVDDFEAEVEICNRGTDTAGPFEVHLYLSADETLDPAPPGSDLGVGSLLFSFVYPGECAWGNIAAYAFGTPEGAYHLAARVDPWNDVPELIESNNDTWGERMGVGSAPDLVVESVSGPTATLNYEAFDASAVVCNRGTVPSDPTSVSFFHSSDPSIEGYSGGGPAGGDAYAGELGVDPLSPGACQTVAGSLWASAFQDGAHYLGAIVDDMMWVSELIEDNNDRAGALMGVGSGPDLRVESVQGPPSAEPGASIAVDYTVCNRGTMLSDPTDVQILLSVDDQISGAASAPGPGGIDSYLGGAALPTLFEDQCDSGSLLVTLPPGALGVHYLGGIVDEWDGVPELIETNNDLADGVIGLGLGPDLVVRSLAGPPSALPSVDFSVSIEVCNQGTAPSGPFDAALYLADDPDEVEGSYFAPVGDPMIGLFPFPPLPHGDCQTEVVLAAVWEEEVGWLGAIVDEGLHQPELRDDNNTGMGGAIGIGLGPDLVVTSLEGPPSVSMGVPYPVTAQVCNVGTAQAPASWLALYHTQDTTVTGIYAGPPGPDPHLGVLPVDPIPPGLCVEPAGVVTSYAPEPGPWYLGCIIDEDLSVPELIESNNHQIGTLQNVTP